VRLELGLNTVWSFKNKVISRVKELEMGGKRPTTSRWEEVILETSQNNQKTKILSAADTQGH